ncbi:MAG: SpoIIE family protein phosphatase [Actinomycetota bacterium]|nr:SpoIIE family protein phosphatase [Actinomycetota bacterium]
MGGPARSLLKPGLWLAAGIVTTTAIAIVDVLAPESEVPLLAIVLGAFVAAFGATTFGTGTVALYSLAAAVGIGAAEDQIGETGHTIRMIAIVVLGCAAVALTQIRISRDRELDEARPGIAEAQRLRIALDAGEMGTWSWDRATSRVEWDDRLESIFGVEPGTFDNTFASWVALLHPDDRDDTLAALNDAIERLAPFRFDHRVTWADGSEHWVEGRGEPVVDAAGQVVGAAGVAIGIDARRQAEAERTELLEAEREARARAEASGNALRRLSELTLTLSGATTVDEIAVAAVRNGTAALGARYGWFATVDEATDELVTRADEGYTAELITTYRRVPLDTPIAGTEALRIGGPIFIESADDRRERFPHFVETGIHGSFAIVPIAHGHGGRGVLSFGYPDARPFSEEDRRYVAAVIEACAQALQRASLFEAEQASRGRLRTLLELSETLAGLDDPDAVLATTARFAADRIGRFASVYVSEPEGLRPVTTVHADAILDPVVEKLAALGIDARRLAERAVAEPTGTLVQRLSEEQWAQAPEDVQELLATLHPTAIMVVAMRVSGRTRGVIAIGHDQSVGFSASDLELAADMGRQTASAHERATLWQASQERFEAEHYMVQLLQSSIVPEQLPDIAGAELAALYQPATAGVDIGGDWYDVFEHHGAVTLVVGDVAGHGVEAASLMGRVRNAFRAYAVDDDDPGSLLQKVDDLLHAFEEHAMVTAVVVRYEPSTGDVAWARAGHLPPLLCDGGGGIRFLDDVNSPPLGTLADGFKTARARLGPGSLLMLYTDGLVERRDCILDAGLDWLADRVREKHTEPLDILCRSLADEPFVAYPSGDDMCVLALRATVK